MEIFKRHKVLFLIVLLLIILPSFAEAGQFTYLKNQLISSVDESMITGIYTITYWFGYIGGIAFTLAGFLIRIGLELNANLIHSPLVQVGWQISRDFANLLLVIAIIVTAFGTILRMESYSYKKLLPAIIGIALLINFSLSLAGIFVDATGVVSNFFMAKSTPENVSDVNAFAANLNASLGLQKLMNPGALDPTQSIGATEFKFGAGALHLLGALFFVVVFTILGAGTMLVLAGEIIARYIALSLLLIILPLALMAFAFPNFRDKWNEWQGKFFEWLFFLPVSLFFIYLTIIFLANFRTDPNGIFQVINSADNSGLYNFISNLASSVAEIAIVIALLAGNLIISKKISGSARDMVANQSYSIFSKLKSGSKKVGKGLAKRPIEAGGVGLRRVGLGLASRLPVVGGAARSYLANRKAKDKEDRINQVDSYQKNRLKNLSDDQLFGYSELGATAKAAKLNELSKRGKLDDFLDEKGTDRESALKPFIDAAKKMDSKKELLKTQPDLAGKFIDAGEDVAEAIEKAVSKISPKDSLDISTSALKKVEVALSLKINQLKEMGRNATPEKKQILQNTINVHLEELKSRFSTDVTEKDESVIEKLQKINDFMEGPAWS